MWPIVFMNSSDVGLQNIISYKGFSTNRALMWPLVFMNKPNVAQKVALLGEGFPTM